VESDLTDAKVNRNYYLQLKTIIDGAILFSLSPSLCAFISAKATHKVVDIITDDARKIINYFLFYFQETYWRETVSNVKAFLRTKLKLTNAIKTIDLNVQ
jgi:hypothetical protein